jgi:8-oxo-dGTP diphosphatase
VPVDTAWHPADALPKTAFDHGSIVTSGVARLRAKLSYTNIAFALAPEAFTLGELRDLYGAALGHDVAVTNLKRVLTRRNLIQPLGSRAAPGPAGGRPPALYRFRTAALQVTDPGAVFRETAP